MMKLKKFLRLYFTFYRYFIVSGISISIVCTYLNFISEKQLLSALIWFKIITLVINYFYIRKTKRSQFYYFKNLGIDKNELFAVCFSFDFLIFIAMISISSNFI